MEKEEDRQREDFPLSEAEKCPIGPIDLSGRIAPLMSQQPQLARHEKLWLKPEHIREPEISFLHHCEDMTEKTALKL